MTETVHWYNPVRRVEEEGPAPMSDAQAIEMLSGDEDSDRFIEVYRQLRNRHPEIVQALIFGRDVLRGAPEGTAPKLAESEPLPNLTPSISREGGGGVPRSAPPPPC